MTDAMMNLNVLLEKTSDADMQREMVGPCGRRFAETHAGGGGADGVGRAACCGSVSPPGRAAVHGGLTG